MWRNCFFNIIILFVFFLAGKIASCCIKQTMHALCARTPRKFLTLYLTLSTLGLVSYTCTPIASIFSVNHRPFYGIRNANKRWCELPDMLQRTWSVDIYENILGEITRQLLIVMQSLHCETSISNMKTFTSLAATGDNYYFSFLDLFNLFPSYCSCFDVPTDRQTASCLLNFLTAITISDSASQTTASTVVSGQTMASQCSADWQRWWNLSCDDMYSVCDNGRFFWSKFTLCNWQNFMMKSHSELFKIINRKI